MAYCTYCGKALQFREAEICPNCGMRINEPPITNPNIALAEPYIGFWTRFGAFLIDFVILSIISMGVLIVLVDSYPGIDGGLSPEGYDIFIIFVFLIIWLYFVLQESSNFQATIGKRAVKIKVVDSPGNKITFWQASLRNFLRIIPVIGFICMIPIGFSEKRQGFHDLAANTYVVSI